MTLFILPFFYYQGRPENISGFQQFLQLIVIIYGFTGIYAAFTLRSLKPNKMKTKTIKQTATFNASPAEVYELIMDERKHSSFTGSEVKMSKKVKGNFEVFDGYCHGYNIELIPGKKIVQAWHFQEDGWPDNHYSICTFLFYQEGDKTKLNFTQTGIPDHKAGELKEGWKDYYWSQMKTYLKNR
jgi:activator of HSP90 ATPase